MNFVKSFQMFLIIIKLLEPVVKFEVPFTFSNFGGKNQAITCFPLEEQ